MSKIRLFSLYVVLFINPLVVLAKNCNDAILPITLHLQDNANGTVSDPKTKLIWKKCSEGTSWDIKSNSCNGSAARYSWQKSLQRAKEVNKGTEGDNLGKTDWRVPNSKELASILELKCWDPAINISVFPSTPSEFYWSSSPLPSVNYEYARGISFFSGYNDNDFKYLNFHVRLVRNELNE